MQNYLVCIRTGSNYITLPSDILRRNSKYFDALIRFSTNSLRTIIEFKEDHALGEALYLVLADLSVIIDHERDPTAKHLEKQLQHTSLDLLFDCILLSSKYLFECLERHYSHQFVVHLRKCAANFRASDVIPPITSYHHGYTANYLSLLDIRRLASSYNLHYLHAQLTELIKEKQTIARQRLRKLYCY